MFGFDKMFGDKKDVTNRIKTNDNLMHEIFRFKMPDLSISVLKMHLWAKRVGGTGNPGDHILCEQFYMARNIPNNVYAGQFGQLYWDQMMPTYGIQVYADGTDAVIKVQGNNGEEMEWEITVDIDTYKM